MQIHIDLLSCEFTLPFDKISSSKNRDPLHKLCLNLIYDTCTSLASHSCFKTEEFSHEYETKDV